MRIFRFFLPLFLVVSSASLSAMANSFSYDTDAFLKPKSSRNSNFEKYFNLYQAKCVHLENPPQPCFLTEKDVDPRKGRAEYVLLFRGEPSLKSQPLTSSFYRWAVESKVACTDNCTNPVLMNYLFKAAGKLSPVEHMESLFYRHQDITWREDSGKLVPGSLARSDTGLEVLAKTHKIGSGLYFEDKKTRLFDPMVSFSFDPLVADLFARQKENKQGALWIASVPKSQILYMKGSECKNLIPEIGKVYDFNGCIDTALNELEIEVNAVMYLPSIYFYDRLLNR